MSDLVPGSDEWELELCRNEYRQAYDQCFEAGRRYKEWCERLEDARQALYNAAKKVNDANV